MVELVVKRTIAAALIAIVALAGGGDAAQATDELIPIVVVGARGDDPLVVPVRVGDLVDGDVLDLHLREFPPATPALARQCDVAHRCAAEYPLTIVEDGTGRAQIRVDDTIGDHPCTRCTLEVSTGSVRRSIELWFGEPAPPLGEVTVSPVTAIVAGQAVQVRARDLPAGTNATVALCDPRGAGAECRTRFSTGSSRAMGPTTLPVDGDGDAVAEVVLQPDDAAPIDCESGGRCAVVVSVDGSLVAEPVYVWFATPPGAGYDSRRLLVGLLLALVLVILAVVVARTTDWSPTGGARAPEIDDAEYADLDAIIAQLDAAELGADAQAVGHAPG